MATQREIFDLPSDGGRFYIKVVSAKRGRTLGKRGILVLPAGRTETGKVLYCYRRYIEREMTGATRRTVPADCRRF